MQIKSSLLGVLLLSAACAGGAVQQGMPAPNNRAIADLPDWMINPPKSTPEHLYASGMGESRDMSIAMNAAEADGRNKIAQSLQIEMKGLEEKFQSSMRGDANQEEVLNSFRQVIRGVTNQTLSGSRVAQRKVTADPSGVSYKAYVLMELDRGAANQALMDKVKSDQALYTRFRASQAFTDLDAEIKKLDEAKKPQTPPQS